MSNNAGTEGDEMAPERHVPSAGGPRIRKRPQVTYGHQRHFPRRLFPILLALLVTGSLIPQLWPALELRPLHLPVLGHGADCPLSPSKYVHDGRPTDEMTGDGPVYVDGYSLVPYDFNPATFGEQIWLIDPGYVGPVLVRARRLDASGVVLFSDQQDIRPWMADLHFAQDQMFDSTWTERTTYFPADAGCYGFQVDGATFSYVIVIGYYNPGLF
jgi:hypothetical protein